MAQFIFFILYIMKWVKIVNDGFISMSREEVWFRKHGDAYTYRVSLLYGHDAVDSLW